MNAKICSISFFIQLQILCFIHQPATVLGFLEEYEVKIVNDLPANTPPLTFHCKSKDDDLGNRSLTKSNGYHWDFNMNLWRSTLFFCSFSWNSKSATFDVFNSHIADECADRGMDDRNYCYWSVQEDGFYFADLQYPFPTEMQKKSSW